MPCQQVVQPPKRPVGRGIGADTPADKTTPAGGTTQDHGRPAVRGQGHGSHSVSHPRGIPEMVGAQLPHQEGGLPCRVNTRWEEPPTPTSSTSAGENPASMGRQEKVPLQDPARLAANYQSSRWQKDIEHILKVYYKFTVDYFTEEDWHPVKEQFFNLFLQHKKETLEVKEAWPLDFMAYLQDLYYQATGLHLDGLTSFTRW